MPERINLNVLEQYFPVVLFIMLYKVVKTFESADEPLRVTIQIKSGCQQYCLSCGAVYYAVQSGSNF